MMELSLNFNLIKNYLLTGILLGMSYFDKKEWDNISLMVILSLGSNTNTLLMKSLAFDGTDKELGNSYLHFLILSNVYC